MQAEGEGDDLLQLLRENRLVKRRKTLVQSGAPGMYPTALPGRGGVPLLASLGLGTALARRCRPGTPRRAQKLIYFY